jgi:hypothetical protein
MQKNASRPYKSHSRSKTIPASLRDAFQPPHHRFNSNKYPLLWGSQHPLAPHKDEAITQVNLAPKTLAESLKQIAVARVRSHGAYYTLVASAYAVLVIGFIHKTPDERNENAAILDAECAKHPEITISENDDFYKKIAMLALCTSESMSQIYDIAHVLKVAEKLQKQASEINEWCVDNNGVQGIRRKYKSDGTLRKPQGITESKNKRLCKLDKTKTKKISDQVSKKYIGTVKAIDLLDVDPPANGMAVTCTAIVTKEPDGSLSIRQIIEHADVLAYAYAAVALAE